MSTVFLGTDEVLDRPVAIKVLKSEFMESDLGARFRREGRTAARLSHPNIVQVYDAGEDDLDGETVSYIVMEHVSGGDLRDLIQERGTLSGEEISNLTGVAAGLAHAHEQGVVHRDIKPPNILLDEGGQPKLADFGIARALDATQATRTGTYMGTARYSSPEQLQGKEITPKSDIYSLGATLYEAVTGRPMFSGTPIEVASQHVSKPPTPPGELTPVDHGLEDLILACLAKNPEDRLTATQVRSRLAEAPNVSTTGTRAAHPATEQTTAVQDAVPAGSGAAAAQRRSRRTPLLVALVAILALLGAVGAFTLLDNGQRAQSPGGITQEAPTTVEATPTPAPQPTAPAPTAPAPATSVPENDPPPDSSSTEQAVAQAVRDVYKLAADGDYGQSYDLLSPAFRQEYATTQAQWSGQFDTLESIRFVEGPDATVSGNAARVTGVTIAEHTDETQRNTVTWTLIREDGQWKLNDLDMIEQELV
jgi:serine/threonine-protein kinase